MEARPRAVSRLSADPEPRDEPTTPLRYRPASPPDSRADSSVPAALACVAGGVTRRPRGPLAHTRGPHYPPLAAGPARNRRLQGAPRVAHARWHPPDHRKAHALGHALCRLRTPRLPSHQHDQTAHGLQGLAAGVRAMRPGHRLPGHALPRVWKVVRRSTHKAERVPFLHPDRRGATRRPAPLDTGRQVRRR